MVFQDPVSSVFPRITVRNIVREPLSFGDSGEKQRRIEALIGAIGFDKCHLDLFLAVFPWAGTHQNCTQAAIVPKLIIPNEPVAALNVLVWAQIPNLSKDFDLCIRYCSDNWSFSLSVQLKLGRVS
jgi:peptide/nickel transport system ATP-binding protein